MRVVSWNMNRRRGSWDFLKNSIKPDVALLQEASPFDDDSIKNHSSKIIVKKNLTNVVYGKDAPPEKVKLPTDGGMGVNVSAFNFDKFGKIFFVSVYGNLGFGDNLDIHLMGVLTLYTETLRKLHGAEHILIAGDFNMDRRMDDNPTGTKFSKVGERRQNMFFDSIKRLGFIDCLELHHPNYVQTHRHNRSDFPWQIDHMFLTETLSKTLVSLEVLETTEVISRSDHNPIIADFDLSIA